MRGRCCCCCCCVRTIFYSFVPFARLFIQDSPISNHYALPDTRVWRYIRGQPRERERVTESRRIKNHNLYLLFVHTHKFNYYYYILLGMNERMNEYKKKCENEMWIDKKWCLCLSPFVCPWPLCACSIRQSFGSVWSTISLTVCCLPVSQFNWTGTWIYIYIGGKKMRVLKFHPLLPIQMTPKLWWAIWYEHGDNAITHAHTHRHIFKWMSAPCLCIWKEMEIVIDSVSFNDAVACDALPTIGTEYWIEK